MIEWTLELEVLSLAEDILRSLSRKASVENWAEHLEVLADQIADVLDIELERG